MVTTFRSAMDDDEMQVAKARYPFETSLTDLPMRCLVAVSGKTMLNVDCAVALKENITTVVRRTFRACIS